MGGLDRSQRAVLALPDDATVAVLGAPGSGKTSTAIELVADRVLTRGYSPDEILLLTPTRASATALRDRVALRLNVPTNGPLARTATSFAFQVVAERAALDAADPPRLLTGGEQDQIVAELLAGFEEDGTGPAWPEQLGAEVRRLRGFRTELRDLMMRCVEYGVLPAELAALGREHGRQEWVAASEFITTYDRVKASYRDRHLDSTELVQEAAAIVRSGAGEGRSSFDRLRLIVLDDAQESTQGTLTLVRAFARRRVPVIAFGDPDISTGSFRGAQPDALGRLGRHLGVPTAPPLVLEHSYRGDDRLRALVAGITGHIGAARAGRQRKASAMASAVSTVGTVLVDSPAEEIAVIARRLRERHVLEGMPWHQMAVMVRSRSLIPALARGLACLEVPTRATSANALRDEPAVRAFILALEVALGRAKLTAVIATELLTGPFGGLDRISLRRLVTALRHEELAGAGDRGADELIIEAMTVSGALATIQTRAGRRARALADSLSSAAAEAIAGATIEELLWGLWRRSRLETVWYEQSQGTGIVADEANRNLDAVVALFSAARRFVERTPDVPPAVFLEHLVDTDVPEDTLAPRAPVDSVTITTPAGAVGADFDTVVIAGLQDGVWPNLRVRGSLLGAQDLAVLASHRVAAAGDPRTDVLHDELRLLAQAASRTRRELFVTAVADQDSSPSRFFGLFPAPDDTVAGRHPLTLRGIVGRLRRELSTTGDPSAAVSLARLSRAGVPGADPEDWYGMMAPSSTGGLNQGVDDGEVRVSPSRLACFQTCALDWVIGEVGGTTSSAASGLGTIIHKAMEVAVGAVADNHDLAAIGPDALWALVEARWAELPFEAAWDGDVHRVRAREMTRRLSSYLRDFAHSGGRLLGTESTFALELEPAAATPTASAGTASIVLSGTIDRVEQRADGSVVIVDLKTGVHEPLTDAAVADNPQLSAYQLAFASGAVEGVDPALPSGGAKLVIISKGTMKRDYYQPGQTPLSDGDIESFRDRVREVAAGMSQSTFLAHLSSHCLDPWSFGECRIHVIKAVSA
ncbi:MAG: ATP-dependent DNA helicase [Microbacteriaceae bacterium]